MTHIYRIKKTKADIVKPIIPQTVFYTLRGNEDVIDENGYPIITSEKIDFICAKLDVSGNHRKCFIRRDGDGSFYNPNGLYAEGYMTRSGKRVSKPVLDFRKVEERVFNLYLQFLKTKNEAWLHNAEREAM